MSTQKPAKGSLRVWNSINPPCDPKTYPVKDLDHAMRLISAMSESQLIDDSIVWQAFGLEVFEDGEWLEWQNQDGVQIIELMDEQ